MAEILRETFETDGNGTRYTTSISEFSDGSGDFFTRTDGANITSNYDVTGKEGNFFFAAQDLDGEGATLPLTLSFENIDIGGFENLAFNVLLAEDDSNDGNEDWDLTDFVKFKFQIDGGGYQNLLAIESIPDDDAFNAVPAADTDFDGDGDGIALTDTFNRFSAAIAGTGASLDLRVTFQLNAGDEDIAIDDLTITGDFTGDGPPPPPPVASGVTINEVDADQTGSDSAEFVELYDGGVGNTPLDGLTVVFFNGSDDASYEAFDLDGFTTNAAGFFVLGNPGVANVDLTFDPGSFGALQNGADAVALYEGDASDFPNDTPATTDNLIDAVAYDTNDSDDEALLAALGLSTQFNEGANGAQTTESNSRVPDGTGTFVAQAPTPGATNVPAATAPDVVINELLISSSGESDNNSNFVELFGEAGASLDGLSLVVLSGEFAPGQVDFVFSLDGFSLDEDGFFLIHNAGLAGEITQAQTDEADLVADFDFFGSPSTFALVQGFGGVQGDDLDGDDDGALDAALGDAVRDAVSLIDGDTTSDFSYGGPILGPSGSFPPASLERVVDGTGDFAALDFDDFTLNTPGFSNESDLPPPPVEITRIFDIQGLGHVSGLVGEPVTTEGVITAVDFNGFYLQDAEGDDDDRTSDALFVFTGNGSTGGLTPGQIVRVSGTVSEFTPGGTGTGNLSTTQISADPSNVQQVGVADALPEAVILGQGGRTPPSERIGDDPINGVYDPLNDGIDFFESVEGMRVTVEDAQAIAPTNRFGEIFTVANQGADATGLSERGTLNISPDDFNPEKIQVQVDNFGDLVDGLSETPFVDAGQRLGDVTGVVSYGFGNFEVLVTEDFTQNAAFLIDPEIAPEVSAIVGAEDRLTVATYNVLNLDPIVEDPALTSGGQSDVDDDVGAGRFDAIARQIVENLNTPDIIGLQEIQNETGTQIDGVSTADGTLQLLVDAIDRVDDGEVNGSLEYAFADTPDVPTTDGGFRPVGGAPGGDIRNAFLWRPDRVELNSLDTIEAPVETQEGVLPFLGARIPLVGSFSFNGEEVVIVNNHFSSKGGSAPIFGVTQPFDAQQNALVPQFSDDIIVPAVEPVVNGGLDERLAQAQAVRDYLETELGFGSDGDQNVVVLGDLNEFEFVDPLAVLEGRKTFDPSTGAVTVTGGAGDLENLVNRIDEDERYSFVFQGNSQQLDHILASGSLADEAEIDIVNVNTEFAETSERASDHDPVLASFRIAPQAPELLLVEGTADSDRLNGTDAAELFVTGTGRYDRVAGGGGIDSFEFTESELTDGLRERNAILDYAEGEQILLGVEDYTLRVGRRTAVIDAGDDRITIRGEIDTLDDEDVFTPSEFAFV